MPKLTEEWIEIDNEHVQQRVFITYTKTELAMRTSAFIRPDPVVITKRGIENNQSNELEDKS